MGRAFVRASQWLWEPNPKAFSLSSYSVIGALLDGLCHSFSILWVWKVKVRGSSHSVPKEQGDYIRTTTDFCIPRSLTGEEWALRKKKTPSVNEKKLAFSPSDSRLYKKSSNGPACINREHYHCWENMMQWVDTLHSVYMTICEVHTYGLKKKNQNNNPWCLDCTTQPKKSSIPCAFEASWVFFLKHTLPPRRNQHPKFYTVSPYFSVSINYIWLSLVCLLSFGWTLSTHLFCDLLTSFNILFLRIIHTTGNMQLWVLCML